MKGVILGYRRGRKTQKTNHMIIQIKGIEDKEKANSLIGKKVKYTTESKKIIDGKVTRVHGSKGLVIARFSKGLPGQSFNKEVEIA